MDINSEHPSTALYGYHNVSIQEDEVQDFVTGVNVFNALSYIPGISVIVGIARIIFAAIFLNGEVDAERRKALGLQILRGFVEILCAGIFYAIPDIIFTINRCGCCCDRGNGGGGYGGDGDGDSDGGYGFQAVQHHVGEAQRQLSSLHSQLSGYGIGQLSGLHSQLQSQLSGLHSQLSSSGLQGMVGF